MAQNVQQVQSPISLDEVLMNAIPHINTTANRIFSRMLITYNSSLGLPTPDIGVRNEIFEKLKESLLKAHNSIKPAFNNFDNELTKFLKEIGGEAYKNEILKSLLQGKLAINDPSDYDKIILSNPWINSLLASKNLSENDKKLYVIGLISQLNSITKNFLSTLQSELLLNATVSVKNAVMKYFVGNKTYEEFLKGLTFDQSQYVSGTLTYIDNAIARYFVGPTVTLYVQNYIHKI